MKTKFNLQFPLTKLFMALLVASFAMTLISCDDDDPKKEDTPELITKVTLVFTPDGGGTPVVATATDPDGEGIQDIKTDGPINLAANTSYTMTIQLINELANPNDEAYNLTAEVQDEGDEHMFFFGWTNNVFSNPEGDGNIDSRNDAVNYEDKDEDGLPIGLTTSWTTSTSAALGTFRIVLKHQPDLKSTNSTSSTGESDLDIEFDITVQ